MPPVVTAFLNHTETVSFDPSVARYLYYNDLAAIHFDDTPVSARKDEIKKLDKLADYVSDGAILGVRYHKAPELRGGLKVGHVGPVLDEDVDQTIHIVVCRGEDAEEHREDLDSENRVVGHIEAEVGESQSDIRSRCDGHLAEAVDTLIEGSEGSDSLHVLQAVELQDAHWVWYRDYPMFGSIRHRGTTARWKSGNQQLVAAYLGVSALTEVSEHTEVTNRLWDNAKRKIENAEEVELLSDGQLEVLCDEYLRSGLDTYLECDDRKNSKYGDYFHLQPTGGTQIAVDIIANDAATETPILSQITFSSGAASKVRNLLSYVEGSSKGGFDLWYFGSGARTDEDLQSEFAGDGVRLRSIEETYELMKQHRPGVVEELLSVPTPGETGSPDVTAEKIPGR